MAEPLDPLIGPDGSAAPPEPAIPAGGGGSGRADDPRGLLRPRGLIVVPISTAFNSPAAGPPQTKLWGPPAAAPVYCVSSSSSTVLPPAQESTREGSDRRLLFFEELFELLLLLLSPAFFMGVPVDVVVMADD